MIHQHLPSDPRIVDEVFNVVAKPGLEDVGWLLGMVAVYGKSPEELKGFSWNEDNSINLQSKKRPVRPLHPQWVFIFQLKEKQPFTRKSRWNPLVARLDKAVNEKRSIFQLMLFSWPTKSEKSITPPLGSRNVLSLLHLLELVLHKGHIPIVGIP